LSETKHKGTQRNDALQLYIKYRDVEEVRERGDGRVTENDQVGCRHIQCPLVASYSQKFDAITDDSLLDGYGKNCFSVIEVLHHMMTGYGLAFSSFPDPNSSSAGGTTHPPGAVELHIPNQIDKAHAVRDRILEELKNAGYDESSRFGIQLAFDEAVANAFTHGNRRRPDATLHIAYRVTPDAVYVSIGDEGDGFDPDAVEDPTLKKNIEHPSGRGLFLMRAYMTNIQYNNCGTAVRMIHCRHPENGPPPDWVASNHSA